MAELVPVGVIGCGRMGKLHARVYSQIPACKLVGVFDADEATAETVASQYDTKRFASPEALLAAVKAVSIATPTTLHHKLALQAISAGVDCLIEKPLAGSVEECRAIATAADKAGRVVQVGHVERFNPAVRAMSRLGIKPRFIEVIRVSPLTFRSIDVGVVLDVMIHDIDIVLSLAGSPVATIDATGVSVIGKVEDVCNARVRFENGVVANLTASRLALKTERRLRVFSADAYVSLDYQKKYGIVARRTGNVDTIRNTVADIRAGKIEDFSQLNYQELVQVEELAIDDVEPLRAELESFLGAVRREHPPEVSAADGLAAVDVARRIVEAMGDLEMA